MNGSMQHKKYDIPELQTFINGIKKDITAVKMELYIRIIMA